MITNFLKKKLDWFMDYRNGSIRKNDKKTLEK